MKKVVLVPVLVVIIILALVVVGMNIVGDLVNIIYDVKFVSVDEEAYIIFDQVSDKKVEQIFGMLSFSPIDNESFYEKYINGNPNYLYSTDVKLGYFLTEKFNEKLYVFMSNNHYFFVKYGDLGVNIYDGMRSCWTEDYSFATNIPYVDDFAANEDTFVPWESSVGLSSYEDLLIYYSRLPDSVYEIDEENKTLYLSVYNKYLGWMESGVKLIVSDEGFTFSLMPEFRDMKVKWDLYEIKFVWFELFV